MMQINITIEATEDGLVIKTEGDGRGKASPIEFAVAQKIADLVKNNSETITRDVSRSMSEEHVFSALRNAIKKAARDVYGVPPDDFERILKECNDAESFRAALEKYKKDAEEKPDGKSEEKSEEKPDDKTEEKPEEK